MEILAEGEEGQLSKLQDFTYSVLLSICNGELGSNNDADQLITSLAVLICQDGDMEDVREYLAPIERERNEVLLDFYGQNSVCGLVCYILRKYEWETIEGLEKRQHVLNYLDKAAQKMTKRRKHYRVDLERLAKHVGHEHLPTLAPGVPLIADLIKQQKILNNKKARKEKE